MKRAALFLSGLCFGFFIVEAIHKNYISGSAMGISSLSMLILSCGVKR